MLDISRQNYNRQTLKVQDDASVRLYPPNDAPWAGSDGGVDDVAPPLQVIRFRKRILLPLESGKKSTVKARTAEATKRNTDSSTNTRRQQ